MSQTEIEIATQPDCWRQAVALARRPDGPASASLPRPGERVAVVGCGTSWFIAQAYAALRESGGHGESKNQHQPGGTPATVALTAAGVEFTVHSYDHD
ncbi:hypothetical protein ACWD25_57915, partial [Streptomyces sp. NPDC002920]